MYHLVTWIQPYEENYMVQFVLKGDRACYGKKGSGSDAPSALLRRWSDPPEYYAKQFAYWRVTEMREL